MNKNKLNKDPEAIGQLFDNIAPTYDDLNHTLSMNIDKRWRREGLKKMDIRSDDMILDIATGTGDLALQALGSYGGNVVGIDLARKMLLVARAKATQRSIDGLQLVQGDGLSMPFPDDAFDKAMIGYGIRNVVDIEAFLEEVHRVLRPGGWFCILELSIPRNRLVRWGYMLYLKRILPRIGGFRSGDMEAYEYLRDSVLDFPLPERLISIMEGMGFRTIEDKAQMFNISHLYLMERI